MEDIPVIVPQLPTENVYVKAVINGLGATIILWSFWTPFILILARPLVNAQIKGAVCETLHSVGMSESSTFSTKLYQYFMTLVDTGVLTRTQANELMDRISGINANTNVARNVINQDSQKSLDDNLLLTVLFVVTYFLIILCCALGIYALSSWFSINMGPIYTFNAVMACIIIAIEASFFGAVAMRFVPFDINLIIEQLQFKLDSYLSDLGTQYIEYGPLTPRPACAFQDPLQDYFIAGWVQPTTSFGTLDEAQQRCILNSQCVGVTQPSVSPGSYILTTTRNKYVEPPESGYHNKGSTSWVLNDCK